VVPLGEDAYIEIFASHTSPDEMSVPTRIVSDLNRFQSGIQPPDFDVSVLEPFRLLNMRGFRYVAVVEHAGRRVVREAAVFMNASQSVEYTVAFQAPESLYQSKRPILSSILSSWRVTPVE
jgi:hypothetical protein